ncbi:MAG: hypothetical protein OHK0029_34320 [Armatimonadaceae bacterium]
MPLLEPSDVKQVSEHTKSEPPVVALNAALLRVLRALIFRTDDHTPLVDLPISQIRCLNAIGNEEGCKMHEVAARLDVKLPAMSQIVERLVQRDLVERRTDPMDRRVTRLYLTDAAKDLIQQARVARLQHVEAAAKRLDPELLTRLTHDMRLLAEAGEAVHGERTGEGGEDVTNTSLAGHDPIVEMLAHRARAPRRAGNASEPSDNEKEEQEE